ncbi:hypothetical protein LX32DRAFT_370715 [Colletotrichum zoysiae]|uniref:Uncharacterized protein n=1 Tax=Colletotrichum zoysiae TaxID=1216348 RepID=A0AAD9HVB5_9PEZI|nr:hypothetical protein LX32DRAFT_370715 [Colletotrichum zoysiae]
MVVVSGQTKARSLSLSLSLTHTHFHTADTTTPHTIPAEARRKKVPTVPTLQCRRSPGAAGERPTKPSPLEPWSSPVPSSLHSTCVKTQTGLQHIRSTSKSSKKVSDSQGGWLAGWLAVPVSLVQDPNLVIPGSRLQTRVTRTKQPSGQCCLCACHPLGGFRCPPPRPLVPANASSQVAGWPLLSLRRRRSLWRSRPKVTAGYIVRMRMG